MTATPTDAVSDEPAHIQPLHMRLSSLAEQVKRFGQLANYGGRVHETLQEAARALAAGGAQAQPTLEFYEVEWQGKKRTEYKWNVDPRTFQPGTKLYLTATPPASDPSDIRAGYGREKDADGVPGLVEASDKTSNKPVTGEPK